MCSITTKRYIFNFELNRRVPNGMHGGVRGRSKSALLDCFEKCRTCGTDKGGSFVTVVRLETKLRATLTEQQKALFEQIKKTDAEITTGMSCKRSQTDFDLHRG